MYVSNGVRSCVTTSSFMSWSRNTILTFLYPISSRHLLATEALPPTAQNITIVAIEEKFNANKRESIAKPLGQEVGMVSPPLPVQTKLTIFVRHQLLRFLQQPRGIVHGAPDLDAWSAGQRCVFNLGRASNVQKDSGGILGGERHLLLGCQTKLLGSDSKVVRRLVPCR